MINAIRAIGRGEVVVVTDDEHRENEGDLIMAAEAVSTDALAFFLEHSSGVICAPLPGERLDELELPLMVTDNREGHRTAFTVSVDLAAGITTGISASDRARTVRALADPHAVASDFVRPGHIFPLRSRPGGVLERPGHTEAGVDLARLAGLQPAAILCEVVTPDRRAMARRPELEALARAHGMPMISVAELVRHRRRNERLIEKVAEAHVPTPHGTHTCQAWRSLVDGVDHIAFVRGDVAGDEPVLVRVHSECLTGDVFGSLRCDCGAQLADALDAIDEAGRGVLVYLRGHEGRGIGIASKLDAYRLQDGGTARLPELERFTREHDLKLISIADLIRYRRQREKLVRRVSEARIPTAWGDFTAYAYENVLDGEHHLALVKGAVAGERGVLVRVHSECLTGDVFGSLRCDCGTQLDGALARIAAEGLGVVVYLRGHEGRGIGLAHKIAAYNLQEQGRDTVDANLELGLPVDDREYGIGSQILVDLGVTTMRLLTNNPAKYTGLGGFGLEIVGRVPLETNPNPENLGYLRTKRERMGHLLDLPPDVTSERLN